MIFYSRQLWRNQVVTIEDKQLIHADTIPATDAFITAATKRGYQCPTTINNYSHDQESCDISKLTDIADLTLLRAEVLLANGDVDGALDSALAVLRMADMFVADHRDTLSYAVSQRLYRSALEVLSEIEPATNEVQQDRLMAELMARYPDPTVPADAVRAEYMYLKSLVAAVAEGEAGSNLEITDTPSSYAFHPNRTTAKIYDVLRDQVTYESLACAERDVVLQQAIEERLLQQKELTLMNGLRLAVLPNRIGEAMVRVSLGSLMTLRHCELVGEYEALLQTIR